MRPLDDLTSRLPERVARPLARARTMARRGRAWVSKGWLRYRQPLTVAMDEDRCENPIMLIGTHRSGTSLLRRCVNAHHNIACPPETFFLAHFATLVEDELAFTGLEGMGFDREAALEGLRQGALLFHEAYRRSKEKPRWADKTPTYVDHLPGLLELLPQDARWVFIFRHPLDVAYSIYDRGWVLWEETGEPRLTATARYVAQSQAAQRAFIAAHRDRCLVLYYDQLVDEPEQTLRALCTFVDEPFDEAMLRHHEQEHDVGTEDPLVRGTKGFKGSFANWAGWSEDEQEQVWAVIAPSADVLGYERDRPRCVSPRAAADLDGS